MIQSALRETLLSYLPAQLLHRLVDNTSRLQPPEMEQSQAAVFFADIKGFTAMTEQFAEMGPEGAEKLTQLLNLFFGEIIEVIHAHGGDVFKFAGDALLAVWKVRKDEQTLESVTHLTAQCAMKVQQAIQSKRDEQGVNLSLKISIGSGHIRTFYVGGVYDRCEFYVAGDPIVQVGRAGGHCNADRVVLSPSAWSLITDKAFGQPLNEEAIELSQVLHPPSLPSLPEPDFSESDEAAIWSFVPRAIRLRLEAGQTSWLAELRPVSVIFVSLPGLNHETPIDLAQSAMVGLQTSLYHYEGSINKLSVDDKGVTLLAAMGLPPLAHEDDAARAVQAAIAMHSKLKELDLRCSIGVASGRVFCGAYGSSIRREYTMIGDTVNLAARLMQAAKGGILCGEEVYQSSRDRLTFEALEPITVKGKCDPVAIYRPLGTSQGKLLAKSVLIGRESQQKDLSDRLSALLTEEEKSVVWIEGEAGIGKTKLVTNLMHQAKDSGMTPLVGAGDTIERSTSYYAWRNIFNYIYEMDKRCPRENPLEEQIRSELSSDPVLADAAPLANVVFQIDWQDNDMTAEMSGEVRAENTNRLLVKLLQHRASQSPLMIVLEDAQWLDTASWALAYLIARDVNPLLMIILTRPLDNAPQGEHHLLKKLPQVEQLQLEPLTEDSIRKMICQRLRARSLPEPIVKLVHEKAQGNPFFSEQLIYALRESGVIVIADEECRLGPDAEDLQTIPFPDTVQGVVTGRIDRLSPPDQLTLKVASVIGRRFPLQLLQDVHPMSQEEKEATLEQIKRLEQSDLISQKKYDGVQVYRFRQAITREVAYNLMLTSQRKQLHQHIAKWYEQNTPTTELPARYPLLAYHWDQAEVLPKAIDYLAKAANQALHNHANDEAVSLYRRLLILDDQAEEPATTLCRAHWERSLGSAFFALGNMAQARKHFHRAVGLLGYPASVRTIPLVIRSVGQLLVQLLHRCWPKRFVRRNHNNREWLLEAASAYESLAETFYHENDKIPCLHAALRSLNLAERAGPSHVLARTYANSPVLFTLLQLPGVGRGYIQRTDDVLDILKDMSITMYAKFAYGVYWYVVGDLEKATTILGQSRQLTQRLGDIRRYGELQFTFSQLACHQGHFQQAAEIAKEMSELGQDRGAFQIECWGLSQELWTLAQLYHTEENAASRMSEVLLRLQRNFEEIVDRPNELVKPDELLAHSTMALAHWYQNNRENAILEAEQSIEIASQCEPISHFTLTGYLALAEVILLLWETCEGELEQELSTYSKRAYKYLRAFAQMHPMGWPYALLYQGRYQWKVGKRWRAKRSLRKCQRSAEKLRMPFEQSAAEYELARITGQIPMETPFHLSTYQKLFEERRGKPEVQE